MLTCTSADLTKLVRLPLLTLATLFVLCTSQITFVTSAKAQTAFQPGSDELSAANMQEELSEKRITPKTEEFKNTSDILREHLKDMREIIMRYNVAEDGAPARKLYSQFISMINDGHALHQKMIAAAIQEYRINPAENEKIGGMLARFTERNVESDRFDGVLEASMALLDANYPEPDLLRRAFLAAAAINRYDEAQRLVDRLDELGTNPQLVEQAAKDLPILKARWAREQELLAKDAAGEPLPRIELVTTKGIIEIELFENQAPNTVANFIKLVEDGFYDNKLFYRVVEHFAAQTGSPAGDGGGNGGFTVPSEREHPDNRDFFRGTVGLALAGDFVGSGSTQFFIVFSPATELDENYTAFGRVVGGMNVLGNLVRIDPDASKEKKAEQKGRIPDELKSAKVLFKRSHPYEPERIDH